MSLRVKINEEHFSVLLRERSTEIYRESGLPYSPFLIADCDDMTHR
jgi:hypothetical protein